MPQRLRHKLGPLDEFADGFAAAVPPSDTPLAAALARYIRAELNLDVPLDAFRPDSAPPHLHMNFRVVDEHGRQLGIGRDLAGAEEASSAPKTEAILQRGAPIAEASATPAGPWATCAELMEIERGGQTLVGYPALVDAGRGGHAAGVRLAGEGARAAPRRRAAAARHRVPRPHARPRAGARQGRGARPAQGRHRRRRARSHVPRRVAAHARRRSSRARVRRGPQPLQPDRAGDRAHRGGDPRRARRAAEEAGGARRRHFPQAARTSGSSSRGCSRRAGWRARPGSGCSTCRATSRRRRCAWTSCAPTRRATRALPPSSRRCEQPYRRELAARARYGAPAAELEQFGWLLEELRVSLFAQELKTPVPVSAKRLAKLWQTMRR